MLVGAYQTLLVILVVSGASKLWRPAQAGTALTDARLVPGSLKRRYKLSHLLGRLLGSVEVVVAITAAFALRTAPDASILIAISAVGVAATFAGFNWFIARLSKIDPGAGCGCFGPTDAPPGPAHRRFNWAATAVAMAIVIATASSASVPNLMPQNLALTLPYLALIAIGSVLFLKGPALLAEVDAAISDDGYDHVRSETFKISAELISRNTTSKRRRS